MLYVAFIIHNLRIFKQFNAIENITTQDFMSTIANIMAKTSIECLYHGNFNKSDAEAAKKMILNITGGMKGMAKKQYPKQEVLITPQKGSHCIVVPTIDPKEPNTAVEIYFQCGKDSVHDRVLIDLLVGIMDDPLYDQLRTKEQFGYS